MLPQRNIKLYTIPEDIPPYKIIKGISILKVEEKYIYIEKNNKKTILYNMIYYPNQNKKNTNGIS